jgi:hypothetical protein
MLHPPYVSTKSIQNRQQIHKILNFGAAVDTWGRCPFSLEPVALDHVFLLETNPHQMCKWAL